MCILCGEAPGPGNATGQLGGLCTCKQAEDHRLAGSCTVAHLQIAPGICVEGAGLKAHHTEQTVG